MVAGRARLLHGRDERVAVRLLGGGGLEVDRPGRDDRRVATTSIEVGARERVKAARERRERARGRGGAGVAPDVEVDVDVEPDGELPVDGGVEQATAIPIARMTGPRTRARRKKRERTDMRQPSLGGPQATPLLEECQMRNRVSESAPHCAEPEPPSLRRRSRPTSSRWRRSRTRTCGRDRGSGEPCAWRSRSRGAAAGPCRPRRGSRSSASRTGPCRS